MIEVKNLCKSYDRVAAVRDLSFSVADRGVYGFLGPNGAGKSTTLNILTGCLAADAGEVKIGGYDIYEDHLQAKRLIGYLPEQPPLYPDMSVREYLCFAAELKGLSRERADMETILARTQLADVQNRPCGKLSKGYQQRVGLAQAVLGYPELIVLDEPTIGLDPRQVIAIRDFIRELGREHTVLFSSHILSEVSAVCDQVLIIDGGRLIAEDTPENLSKKMHGGITLVMEIGGRRSAVKKALAQVGKVRVHTVVESGENAVTATLEIEDDAARDDIFFVLAKAGCPIRNTTEQTASLEEIFLRLTDSADRAASASDEPGADESAPATGAGEHGADEPEPTTDANETDADKPEPTTGADETDAGEPGGQPAVTEEEGGAQS